MTILPGARAYNCFLLWLFTFANMTIWTLGLLLLTSRTGIGFMSPNGINSTNVQQRAGRNNGHNLINMTASIVSLQQVYGLRPYQLECSELLL